MGIGAIVLSSKSVGGLVLSSTVSRKAMAEGQFGGTIQRDNSDETEIESEGRPALWANQTHGSYIGTQRAREANANKGTSRRETVCWVTSRAGT